MDAHRAKKALGQNFLMHQQTAERIAEAAQIAGKTVLEIGPGTGMLTKALLARAARVIAIEADSDLIPRLEETFFAERASGKLELIQGDARTFDTEALSGDYALVANIPYYITGELFRKFLTAPHKPVSMTLLVQKEVAVRIAREKKESLLSLSVKAFGTPIYEFTVPRGAFKPAPKVDSAVLSVRNINAAAFSGREDEEAFFQALHAGFAHKRKQLGKNLAGVFGEAAARKALEAAGIAPKTRAEDVSLGAWRALSAALS